MARKFEELRKQMSPERRRRAREHTLAMLLAMDLAELRGSLGLTQEEIAERLDIAQSNVSRLERREDMLVSTLRRVVEAYGGRLRLIADFPDGPVEIGQFDREVEVSGGRPRGGS
jgi:transcriptional regulator with XRE-family HTH domain